MSKLVLITGNDEDSIKEKSAEVIKQLCGSEPSDCSYLEIINCNIDGKTAEDFLTDLLITLKTPPFLEPLKVVWFKHFPKFEDLLKKSNSKKAQPVDELLELIASLPEQVSLLVDGKGVKKTTSFYKKFDKLGKVIFCERPEFGKKDYEKLIQERVKEYCNKEGKTINQGVIDYLITVIGSNPSRLKSEIEKLFCYIGENTTITLQDCIEICSKTEDALGWELSNAITDQNTAKALKIIDTISKQKTTSFELMLLITIMNKIQAIIEFSAFCSKNNIRATRFNDFKYQMSNLPSTVVESNPKLSKKSTYPAFFELQAANKLGNRKLAMMLNELTKANKFMVSSIIDNKIILEEAVIKITSL